MNNLFLQSKPTIKGYARELESIEQIEGIQEYISSVLNERKNEIKRMLEDEEKAKEAINSTIALLREQGVSKEIIERIIGTSATKPVKQDSAKYEKDGVKWSGKGKPPAVFAAVPKEELINYLIE